MQQRASINRSIDAGSEISQALIYPGLGFGTILADATKMTDKMIVAGSKRLSELAPALKDSSKALLPEFGGKPTHVNSAES